MLLKYFNVLTLKLQTLAVLKAVLEAKEVAEEAVRGSDMNYTVIRPGGLLSAVRSISLGEIVIIFISSGEGSNFLFRVCSPSGVCDLQNDYGLDNRFSCVDCSVA